MLLKNENQIIRVLKSHGDKALVIDCIKRTIQEVVSISIAALVQQAKNEGRAVTDFLKSYITVEEVGI